MSMVSLYSAHCWDIDVCWYTGWWPPLSATEASNSAPCSTHSACPWSHSLGDGTTAAPSPFKRELSHFLGCLCHLLCQERTALAELRVSGWTGQRGQDHSLPCQDQHISTSTECLGVSRQQALRPSSWRLLFCLEFSCLWEEECVSTHTSSSLLSFPALSTEADRHSDKSDQMTAPTKPLGSFLSHKSWLVCSVPASKLTSVTIHTEKAWGKSSSLECFPLSHAFWPTTVLYLSLSIISDPVLANTHDPQHHTNMSDDVTDTCHLGLLPPGQPPPGISCL